MTFAHLIANKRRQMGNGGKSTNNRRGNTMTDYHMTQQEIDDYKRAHANDYMDDEKREFIAALRETFRIVVKQQNPEARA